MMKKLCNAIFLISGTAIGAGLIALPLMAIHIGSILTFAILLLMALNAYRTSMMLVDLNIQRHTNDSILTLSRDLAGTKTFKITAFSFYALSFALLTVYLSGMASSLSTFFHVRFETIVLLASVLLLWLLSFKLHAFSNFNGVLVLILLGIIIVSIAQIQSSNPILSHFPLLHAAEICTFIPIAFTSFGVQNICHCICHYLENDRKKIQCAFIIGIAIPLVIYILWISCVLQSIQVQDIHFFHQMQQQKISVGSLIQFLCQHSQNVYTEIFLKSLTLLAIITSALGIAISLKEPMIKALSRKSLAHGCICLIPALCAIYIPNAFIHLLALGGAMATCFVIFVPYYLSLKTRRLTAGDQLCLLVGIVIVCCEIIPLGLSH